MAETQHNPGEEEIFGIARAIASKEQRIQYLDQDCSGDPQRRQSVEELLAIYDREQSFLESPHPDMYNTSFDNDPAGSMIGPYKILEAIGEGGMGNVYLAEQIEPVHRKVALKVIKAGMDSKSVIARFEAERQALALMDHPNIAKFYDAGISDTGRPYFVMELVKGRPIIEFCQRHKLDLKAKLHLFTQVCQGVQHAHQKGVIHRDLKPSNVLVALYDDQPVAKVIDFGVAKAIGEKLTDKTMFTRFGQLVGTLEYMSPEQAQLNQLDVDTRSDVYSLGAILYELLTGEPPFERERLSSAALEEVLRIIREDEPAKPSTRLSSSSAVNQEEDSIQRRNSQKPVPSIPADMDWIVMKCLEKDRARRYASTSDLFQDVLRYLSNEPVSAGPPNSIYRLKKFARRNRATVFVCTVVAASLLIGIGVSTWQAARASRAEQSMRQANTRLIETLSDLKIEKEKSDQQREKAETEQRRATGFLSYIVDTFKSPLSSDRADARVIDVLRIAAENAESKFHDDPVVAARILESIAETFTFMKRGEDAIPIAVRAREILKDNLGSVHPEALRAFCYVYWAYHESPLFGKVDRLTISRRVDHALVLARSGDESAKTVAAQAAAEAQQHFANSPIHLSVLDRQADVHWELDDIDRAIELVRQRMALEVDYQVLWPRFVLLSQQKQHQTVIQLFQAVIPVFESADAPPNVDKALFNSRVVALRCQVGAAYFRLKNYDKTIEWMESGLSSSDTRLGEESETSRQVLRYMIFYNRVAIRYTEADKVAQEHLSRIRKYQSKDAMTVADGLFWAGLCSFWVERPEDSIASFREYFDVVHQVLGQKRGQPFTMDEAFDHCRNDQGEGPLRFQTEDVRFMYIAAVGALANAYIHINDLDQAIPLVKKALPFYFDVKTKNPVFANESRNAISAGASLNHRLAAIRNDSELVKRASQLIEELVPKDWKQVNQTNDYKGAVRYLTLTATHERNAVHSEQKWDSALVLERLGYCQFQLDDFERAQKTLTEFFSVANGELIESHVGYRARHELGAVLLKLENAEGEDMFLEGAEQLWNVRTKLDTNQRWYLLEVLQRVVDYYLANDDQDHADQWKAKQVEFEKPSFDQ